MTTTQELAYQARIRELRDKFEYIKEYWNGGVNERAMENACWKAIEVSESALSRPDDLSALEAYVLEEKRKVLDEAMKEFGEDAFLQNGTKAVNVLRGMAKELK
mgnify:FL=1